MTHLPEGVAGPSPEVMDVLLAIDDGNPTTKQIVYAIKRQDVQNTLRSIETSVRMGLVLMFRAPTPAVDDRFELTEDGHKALAHERIASGHADPSEEVPSETGDVVMFLADEPGTVSELADRLGWPIEQVQLAVEVALSSGWAEYRREGKPELVATDAGVAVFVAEDDDPEPSQAVTLSPESVEAVAQRVVELLHVGQRDAVTRSVIRGDKA